MPDKPNNWPTIPSLHRETQIYTQQRSTAEAPANYKFTINELALFIAQILDLAKKPLRYTYAKQSGKTLLVLLPAGTSFPADNQILVFVEGRGLIPWGQGLSRQNNTLTFTWSLDQETVEILIYL